MKRYILRSFLLAGLGLATITSCSDEYADGIKATSMILEQTSLSFDYTSSSKIVKVRSLGPSWKVTVAYSNEKDWISVTPQEGGNGTSVTIKVTENNGSNQRKATLKLVSKDGKEQSNTITITQESKNADLLSPHTFPSEGGVQKFTLSSDWTTFVPKEYGWIHIDPDNVAKHVYDEKNNGWKVSARATDELVILVDETTILEDRTGHFNLAFAGQTFKVEVKQTAAGIVVLPSKNCYFNANAGTTTLNVKSHNAFTAKSQTAWIKTELNNSSLAITVEENLTGKERQGTVVLSNENNANSVKVVVTQTSQHADITIEDYEGESNLIMNQRQGHGLVDLGLSVYWASCNVGAKLPENSGDYYAWGETTPKKEYSWSTYVLCDGTANSLKRYNDEDSFGQVDNQTKLTKSDDAATANWGNDWRMPTLKEMKELMNCKREWRTMNGVVGMRIIGNNNASIFLPAAGYMNGMTMIGLGVDGWYWSSETADVCHLYSASTMLNYNLNWTRCLGCSIRPVTAK